MASNAPPAFRTVRNNVEGVYVEVTVPVFVPTGTNISPDGTAALGASSASDTWRFTRSWSGDLGSRPYMENSSFLSSAATENASSRNGSRSSGGRSPTTDPPAAHHPSSRRPPSRPPNSFMLYRQVKQAELRSAYHTGTITTTALSGIIADMWNRESAGVRQYYSDRALLLRQQHQINFPDTGRVGPSRAERRNSISTVSSTLPTPGPGSSPSSMTRVFTADFIQYGASSSFGDDYRDGRGANSGGTSGISSADETAFQSQSGARFHGGDGPQVVMDADGRSVRVININNNVRVITPEAYEHLRQHFHVRAPFLNRADDDALRRNPHETGHTTLATMDGVTSPAPHDDGGLAVPHALRRVATSTPAFAIGMSDLRDLPTLASDDMDAAGTTDSDGSPWVGMSPSLSSDSAFGRPHEPDEIFREPGLSIAITRMHLQGGTSQPPPQPAAVLATTGHDAPIDCDAYLGPGALNWPDGDNVDATPFLVTLHPPAAVPPPSASEITDPPPPHDIWREDAPMTAASASAMSPALSATSMFTAAAAATLPPFAFGSGSKHQIGSAASAATRPPGRLPAPTIVGRRRKTPK